MLAAVKGYYDGTQIVVNEEDRRNFNVGDELIITILSDGNLQKSDARVEKRKKMIERGMFVKKTERSAEEIDNYMRELRDNDRF